MTDHGEDFSGKLGLRHNDVYSRYNGDLSIAILKEGKDVIDGIIPEYVGDPQYDDAGNLIGGTLVKITTGLPFNANIRNNSIRDNVMIMREYWENHFVRFKIKEEDQIILDALAEIDDALAFIPPVRLSSMNAANNDFVRREKEAEKEGSSLRNDIEKDV